MKLQDLKEKLVNKFPNRESSIKDDFKKNKFDNFNSSKLLVSNNSLNYKGEKNLNNENKYNLDNLVIIGVTGSKGKSTVCKMIHEYLKSIGKKSILYSSVEIDSLSSLKLGKTSCERAINGEEVLLDIIEEAEAYECEYLILEVNDMSISKGLVKDIPFDIRVLTNIHKKNSKEFFSIDEYIEIKKSFIRDIDKNDSCKCIIGMCDQYLLEEFNDLIRICPKEVITYGSKYLCDVWNVNDNNLDYMVYGDESSNLNTLNGINFKVRMNELNYDIKAKSIFSFSTLNILSVISVLDTLNLFDVNSFNKLLGKINIDGRDELICVNGRYFLIGISLMPHLELLNIMKEKNEFNKLKVITASIGENFVTWDKEFSDVKRLSKLEGIRRQAMRYVDEYADVVYLTSNDPASTDKQSLIDELKSHYKNLDKIRECPERKEAIKFAVNESEKGDLIYISGRGNRNRFCNTFNEMQVYTDKDVLMQVLKDKGWI